MDFGADISGALGLRDAECDTLTKVSKSCVWESGVQTERLGTERPRMVSLSDYRQLLKDRPAKFSESDVFYRRGEGKERCRGCFHFFTNPESRSSNPVRQVCEIFRPRNDESVKPEWVCDFWTKNGSDFPLLERKTE